MQRGLHGSLDPTCVIEGSVAKKGQGRTLPLINSQLNKSPSLLVTSWIPLAHSVNLSSIFAMARP